MKKINTPECDKLAAVRDRSQVVGEFIEWLTGEKGIELAIFGENEEGDEALLPFHFNRDGILAEFFDIDMNRVEKERRAILAQLGKS